MLSKARILYLLVIILTVLLVVINMTIGRSDVAKMVMFSSRLVLFLAVLFAPKFFLEQKLLGWAFGLTLVSDFFFVFIKMEIFNLSSALFDIVGIAGFIGAYLLLIIAFAQNYHFNKLDLMVAIPFIIGFALVLRSLRSYVSGILLIEAIALGVILCLTTVTMIATIYRDRINRHSASFIALAAIILYGSDILVAYSMFHPDFQQFILWHQNAIWISYMLGWLILLAVVNDRHLHRAVS